MMKAVIKEQRKTLTSIFHGNLQSSFCILKTINAANAKGKLTIIPTPIGNLNDLTPNILKALFKADLIGCQDRRVAGQLYTLIRNRKMIETFEQKFGSLGLTSLMPFNENESQNYSQLDEQKTKAHQFYEYSNMTDRNRRKFLAKMTLEQEKQFKIEFLKYRAKKIVNKSEEFAFKSSTDKFDELYGLNVSDFQHIQSQIMNSRIKKGRGLLIPLNTYSETKMFDLVQKLLESKNVAIVSDAGMPCISDPGWRMVKMIRETMPKIEVQVIGGPSAVDIMLTLSTLTSKNNSLSGRFQGFAAPEVSNMTEEGISLNKDLKNSKDSDFSIHFINSKKLKKKVYSLEKIYGGDHRIIIANQLTKKFERKFNGSLRSLVNLVSKEEKQFEGIGEMSYLLYPQPKQLLQQEQKAEIEEPQEQKINHNSQFESININKFIQCLNLQGQTKLQTKVKAEIVASIFGLKLNQAKRFVYANTDRKERMKEVANKLK